MATVSALVPVTAYAQTPDDVVVMRRVLTPPKRTGGPVVTPPGDETPPDETPPDETPPDDTQPPPSYTYSWLTSVAGPWESGCSEETTRPLSAVCRRNDTVIVADSFCAGQEKPVEETGSNFEGCGYEWRLGTWSDWSLRCSARAIRSRTVSCISTLDTSVVLSDQICLDNSIEPFDVDGNSVTPLRTEQGTNATGCDQVVTNGSFNAQGESWVLPAGAAILDAGGSYDGRSLSFSANITNAAFPLSQDVETIPGATYKVSIYFRSTSTRGIEVRANGNVVFQRFPRNTAPSEVNQWIPAEGNFVASSFVTTIDIQKPIATNNGLFCR